MVHAAEAKRSDSQNFETVRTDWDRAEAEALYALPFADLIFQAQCIHRDNFDPNHVETASLLSIKTGGCPEDCGYCSQSAHYDTGLKATRLMDTAEVVATAQRAKDAGATRFCMAAAWRNPKDHDLDEVCDMVSAVKGLGMETCARSACSRPGRRAAAPKPGSTSTITTSILRPSTTARSSPPAPCRIVSIRWRTCATPASRSVVAASSAWVNSVDDRLGMLVLLANLPSHPESVPINLWNEVKGVPVNDTAERPDPIALVRLIAVARIMMPKSVVRLSAGRQYMTDELQALCFLAGANSIFIGDVLLTTKNPQRDRDANLLERLGMTSPLGQNQVA